jgi:peptide/nickel transport system substrate-binding protein
MGGFGVNTNGNRDPNMLGADPNLGEYPYDVEKAKQLIADSGYQGQPVVVETGQGFTFKDAEIAQAVGAYLQKAGLNSDVRILEGGAYNAKKSNVDIEGIINTSSGNNIHDFENVLDDLMVRAGTDVQQWKHPQAMQYRMQLEQTIDPQERIKLAQEGAQLLKADAPIVIIAAFVNAYGMKKTINWDPRPDQSIWIREFKAS